MSMGQTGMADMGTMGMPMPRNSLPMMGGPGPFDYIAMGGMFTLLKIRDGLQTYDDPGWYKNPEGTVAAIASADQLSRDGIDVNVVPTKEPPPEHQHSG
jgi:hypothetical protein